MSSRAARALPAAGSVAISGIAMILLAKSTGWVQIPLVMISFAVCSITYALGPTLVGEISPVKQRGAMLGISNALFSTAGLIAPWLMGHIVDVGANPAQGFRDGFLMAGILILAGGVIAMLLISPEDDLARFRRRAVQSRL
jgi:MFS family permease